MNKSSHASLSCIETLRKDLIQLQNDSPEHPLELKQWIQACLSLAENPESTRRETWEPGHFTASGLVLSPDHASVLLIFHHKLQKWLQPGGHIDPDDPSALAAAQREINEETGVRAHPLSERPLIDVDVHPIPALKAEPAHQHFDLRFGFIADSEQLTPNSEVEAAKWVRIDAILASQAAFDTSLCRCVSWLHQRMKNVYQA